ncbi:MAG: hypothetical protein A3H69_00965 [Candidatus Sungbacteria bacterium RIFCSPLOWO2_02_FULL_47_9]|uniref:Glycosyltransferase 2-like domain-containing protein n=1 Tax=Candidatus Sungbacteria bacterium RIFCSPHIGHO2_01_FULL_47_32 TaxID=1802264 RepID=A0A1G2KB64_9BACT|nr:MAG: Dolichyl-phosphate beta-D-mannosyltransferase [Parcubacteria group bacterium GW2011_GWA2_47_10]OGZ95761.1 MAG: hypothetical protein A2633_00495 [Candidatus Sungbacteria bacterium RIFCSPHIGHO2_01_FULL_47_32]OGZ99076.1 MAG: hypothetical protein A3D57_03420 [Candidatus Sungbacteria bacterium RIFCSPHIGHO2_02_FULL_46_12]OHA04568.1 MAG: hypothetical protein A3A28_01240 [Candidatus Sungbacteria bacterium RIFCSPLOWO2_01_FULL_47_32]OHA09611.1 MAG: hypothetical protein A3H69_00965 [Candidatus Sun
MLIVVPTYNEKNNLPELAEKIFGLGIAGLKLVVVDDSSPDGTGAVAERLREKYPMRVIHRPHKAGLGRAYAHAFSEILSSKDSFYRDVSFIIQMDADLSHDPAIIPELLRELASFDVVVGSRYVPGGSVENWDSLRRFLSRASNMYARVVLGLPYRDLTSGFKGYRRKALESLDMQSLSSIGYSFQIETLFRAHRKGYRITEIPISFRERKTGVSKLDVPIILEIFFKVLALRFSK